MMTDEISEFLEKIDSEHFNCVYSCNGVTLMRTDECSNILEEITELKREVNKYKQLLEIKEREKKEGRL